MSRQLLPLSAMIPLSPVSLLPAVINHLLDAEPWALKRLAVHAGSVAYIDAGIVILKWKILSNGSISNASDDAAPSVTIRVAAADLAKIAQRPDHAFSFVKIEGDAGLAAAISEVGQAVRWDAEGDLSRIVGDIAAVRLTRGTKSAWHTVQSMHRAATENIVEYLTEEKPVLIRPDAVNEFSHDSTRLRDEVERLAKRIERLEKVIAKGTAQ